MTAVLILLAAASALAAVIETYRRKRLYWQVDRMLDRLLEQEAVRQSGQTRQTDRSVHFDLQEGELPALAHKIVRIQEKIGYELGQAQEEKEQVKSLISNMSHQLKTPLGNVMMYRELLDTEADPAQQKLFLHKMKQQLDKTDWILQSLFKMVRLEQGAIQFEAQAESLKETLRLAVNSVYEKAEKKDIQICAQPFADCRLLHNRKWTAEVFCNILENAVKYSEEGSRIQIRVYPMELFTEIRITDWGMGIRQEELVHIFKRFYRSKDAENKEGSGIGLYLSRLILEQEQGYMTVTSEYGIGSSFHVFLQNCQN